MRLLFIFVALITTGSVVNAVTTVVTKSACPGPSSETLTITNGACVSNTNFPGALGSRYIGTIDGDFSTLAIVFYSDVSCSTMTNSFTWSQGVCFSPQTGLAQFQLSWPKWEIRTTYASGGCVGPVVHQYALSTSSCSPMACSATNFPGQSGETTCSSSTPSIPANLQSQYVWTRYVSTTTCSGAFDQRQAMLTGQCFASYRNGAFQSQRTTCNADGSTNLESFISSDCSGSPGTSGGLSVGVCDTSSNARRVSSCPVATTTTTTTTPATTTTTTTATAGVTTAAPTTAPSSGSAPCFHVDTVIEYAGQRYSMEQIRDHPECAIPHIVSAHGVTITANCAGSTLTLKLTRGHLVYTQQRGLQAAGDLKPRRDTVFADLDETKKCNVVAIEEDPHLEQYFGLNCIRSQVLANGVKASTFEKLHNIPAWWMHVVGRIIGIKHASALGDRIASLAQQMNIV